MEPLSPQDTAALLHGTPSQPAETVVPTPEVAPTPQPAAEAPSAPAQPSPTTDLLKPAPTGPRTLDLLGKLVVVQKPTKPVNLIVARVLGLDSSNPMLDTYYKALMWVKQIGNIPIPEITDRRGFEAVHELLGDDALDALVAETVWAGLTAGTDWEAVKKS